MLTDSKGKKKTKNNSKQYLQRSDTSEMENVLANYVMWGKFFKIPTPFLHFPNFCIF